MSWFLVRNESQYAEREFSKISKSAKTNCKGKKNIYKIKSNSDDPDYEAGMDTNLIIYLHWFEDTVAKNWNFSYSYTFSQKQHNLE